MMGKDYKEDSKVRGHDLRVPVFPNEKTRIQKKARAAGMSVARYLREVGQGYQIMGIVDYEQVRKLAKINGDLGRLGGLLKLWLTNDERIAQYGEATVRAVLSKIAENQDEMARIMSVVVMPKADQ